MKKALSIALVIAIILSIIQNNVFWEPSFSLAETMENIDRATPSEVKETVGSKEDEIEMDIEDDMPIATDSNASRYKDDDVPVATDSNAHLATDSNAHLATDSNAKNSYTYDFNKIVNGMSVLTYDSCEEINKENPLMFGEKAIFRFSYKCKSYMKRALSDGNDITLEFQLPNELLELTEEVENTELTDNPISDTLSYVGSMTNDGYVDINILSENYDEDTEDFYIDLPLKVNSNYLQGKTECEIKFKNAQDKLIKYDLYLAENPDIINYSIPIRPNYVPDEAIYDETTGHYYMFYNEHCTWDEAKAYCEGFNGHLVTITSKAEKDFVGQLLTERYGNGNATGGAWIGFYYSDGFKWVTGEPFEYTNWNPGEPNYNEPHGLANRNQLWNDADKGRFPFICEWEDQDITHEQPDYIPEDAIYNENNGHWYKLYEETTSLPTWTSVKKECERLGGYLITITSADEQNFMKKISNGKGHIWLGATDEKEEGHWEWVTGEKFGEYTNWTPGEPNNEENREHYMVARGRDNYTWDDRFDKPTNGPYAFICEWEDQDEFVINEKGELIAYNGSGGDVVIPSGVERIGDEVFFQKPIISVSIPEGVTSIGRNSFKDSKLERVDFPDSITEIEEGTFQDCTNLKEVIIPFKVERLPDNLFRNCTNLRSIFILPTVTTISDNAFDNCKNILTIYGERNSYVEVYAEKNSIKFVSTIFDGKCEKSMIYRTREDVGTFSLEDMWNYKNFSLKGDDAITFDEFQDIFYWDSVAGPTISIPLWSALFSSFGYNGSGGLCYGLSITSGAINYTNIPKVNSFIDEFGQTSQVLSDVKLGDYLNNKNITALQLIKYGHSFQACASSMVSKLFNKNIEELYKNVKNSIGSKNPVLITIGGELNKKAAKHTLLALDVEDFEDKSIIWVYDSNVSNLEYAKKTDNVDYGFKPLVLYKEKGKYFKWEYLISMSKDVVWGTEKEEEYISYDLPVTNFIRAMDNGIDISDGYDYFLTIKCPVTIIADDNKVNTNCIDNKQVDFILPVIFDGVEDEKFIEEHSYWIKAKSKLTFTDIPQNMVIVLAMQDQMLEFNLTEDSILEYDIEKNSAIISMNSSGAFGVECAYQDDSDCKLEGLSVSGYAKKGQVLKVGWEKNAIYFTGNDKFEVLSKTSIPDNIVGLKIFEEERTECISNNKHTDFYVERTKDSADKVELIVRNNSDNLITEGNQAIIKNEGENSGECESNNTLVKFKVDIVPKVIITQRKLISGTWVQESNKWKLLKEDGSYAKSQWALLDGRWYIFNEDGYMIKGMCKVNGIQYFFNVDGTMATGWVQFKNSWYYFDINSGAMKTGWIKVEDKWYYLTADGTLIVNSVTPDGYKVNEKGEWIQ